MLLNVSKFMAGGPVASVLLHQLSLLGADPESAVKMKSPVFFDAFSQGTSAKIQSEKNC